MPTVMGAILLEKKCDGLVIGWRIVARQYGGRLIAAEAEQIEKGAPVTPR